VHLPRYLSERQIAVLPVPGGDREKTALSCRYRLYCQGDPESISPVKIKKEGVTMAEAITVKVGEMKHQKWQRLLLYMQNSPQVSFKMQFDNREEARATYQRLRKSILAKPTWFSLLLFLRDTEIYIVKPDKARKVVVVDG
jgi:hypothetical protein